MDLPPYYGKNLDALHDVLTSFREPIYFRIEYSATLVACLGNYGKTLLQVFKDAAAENENITLEIE